jgi:hypothetical protein
MIRKVKMISKGRPLGLPFFVFFVGGMRADSGRKLLSGIRDMLGTTLSQVSLRDGLS